MNASQMLRLHSDTGDDFHELPRAYHNLIRLSVLNAIKARTGKYFDSMSPDIYSAYAVASSIDFFVTVDYPMTITGASPSSNTIRLKNAQGGIHFSEFNNFQFSPLAPESWQLCASNSDSMVRAIVNCGRQDIVTFVDFNRIFARTIVAEPGRTGEHVLKFIGAMRYLEKSTWLSVLQLIGNVGGKVALSLIDAVRVREDYSDDVWYSDIKSISEAVYLQQKWLLDNNVVLPSV